MRKLFAAAALIAVTSASASAADLGPRYTKAPVMAPVWSWTGCGGGGHVGGGGGGAGGGGGRGPCHCPPRGGGG
ncbi:MAG TPA: hypothetical protein DCR53_11550 [Afipia sp.]|nr:hypothetical protein [Afipia sp.]